MPASIRLQTDRISADLAAQRLRRSGIPAEVVSDSDFSIGLATTGTPLSFSLLIPSQFEEKARDVLAQVEPPKRR